MFKVWIFSAFSLCLRYDSWEDPETPKYHYGSHYSNPVVVLEYLIRLPPFSQENMKLQQGKFDKADRLFASVAEMWHSASAGNTQNVRELIPEFFYTPLFLENRFQLDLGTKQTGERVKKVFILDNIMLWNLS